MTQKEQTRLKVLNSVLEDRVSVSQAAEVMGVSERHTRRILRAYRNDGARALSHGNRGRRPTNSIDKVHIGVDAEMGVVHRVSTTLANVHDVRETPRLLHGGETQVWGDAGYLGVEKRPRESGHGGGVASGHEAWPQEEAGAWEP